MHDKIDFWLTEQDILDIYSNQYWNDEEKEKAKAWYIIDGNADKLIKLLKDQTTCLEEFEDIIKLSGTLCLEIKGVG